jgi:hypothetical protein
VTMSITPGGHDERARKEDGACAGEDGHVQ